MRILVLDDDPLTVEYLSRALESEGHFVICAATVAEARSSLQKGEVEILLTDLDLPDGSGDELMPLVRELKMRSIILSGYSDSFLPSPERPVDRILVKPVDLEVLFATIRELGV